MTAAARVKREASCVKRSPCQFPPVSGLPPTAWWKLALFGTLVSRFTRIRPSTHRRPNPRPPAELRRSPIFHGTSHHTIYSCLYIIHKSMGASREIPKKLKARWRSGPSGGRRTDCGPAHEPRRPLSEDGKAAPLSRVARGADKIGGRRRPRKTGITPSAHRQEHATVEPHRPSMRCRACTRVWPG